MIMAHNNTHDDHHETQRGMSIVPYGSNREVVLSVCLFHISSVVTKPSPLYSRHNDSVVVFDPQSKQLVLRDASSDGKLELADCPYCHRSLRREENGHGHEQRSPSPGVAGGGFVSPEYFRMLHQSLPGSENSSAPPSPRRRLVQPVGYRHSSPISTGQGSDIPSRPPGSPPSPSGISSAAFSPNYFQRFFVEEKELGRGGKGVVLLVKHVLDGVTLGHFACKRVPVGDDHEWLEKVLIEVQLLQYLSHQHLVSYRHVWLEDTKLSNFGPSVPCAFILQQYCNSGDLHNYIMSPAKPSDTAHQLKERLRRRSKNELEPPRELRGRKLQFEEIYSFFKDITSGLNHLHVNGYIHRDLKPSNCLLHDAGKGLRVLVSDFGEVQVEHMVRKSTGATGTISYCAPEVLRRKYPSGAYGNFTTKSDIFSLGMILYFLCFARLPYRHADNFNEENEDLDLLRDEITSWSGLHDERKMRPDLPEKLYTFLRRLLSLDPADRPSAEEILYGIKTGSGLDEISDARPPSNHAFDDLRKSSRISPIDSPQSGTPMPQTPTRKMSTGFVRPGGPAKLRLNSYPKEHTWGSPTAEDESPTATSPSRSLVVQDRYPSPTKIRKMPQLEAPSPRPLAFRLDVHNPAVQRTLHVGLLLLKIFSVNMLCAPMAANPLIAYPLLFLAVLDLWLSSAGPGVSILLMLVHVTVLLGARVGGVLCMAPVRVWEGI